MGKVPPLIRRANGEFIVQEDTFQGRPNAPGKAFYGNDFSFWRNGHCKSTPEAPNSGDHSKENQRSEKKKDTVLLRRIAKCAILHG